MNKFIEIHERFIANIKKTNPKLAEQLEKMHIAHLNRLNKAKHANKTKQDTQD